MSYLYALPSKLTLNGYSYTRVLRKGSKAIYEQRVGQKAVSFEVFIVKVLPRKELFKKTLVKREKFPRNEDFGYSAWTYRTKAKALKKFNEIVGV